MTNPEEYRGMSNPPKSTPPSICQGYLSSHEPPPFFNPVSLRRRPELRRRSPTSPTSFTPPTFVYSADVRVLRRPSFYRMSSRGREDERSYPNRRRRGNQHEVIVISDDESEDGVIANTPTPQRKSPVRTAYAKNKSATRPCDMRGHWPFKRKNILSRGESSREKQPPHIPHIVGIQEINENNKLRKNVKDIQRVSEDDGREHPGRTA